MFAPPMMPSRLSFFHLVTWTSCMAWGVDHSDLQVSFVQANLASIWITPCILTNFVSPNGHVVTQTPKSLNGQCKVPFSLQQACKTMISIVVTYRIQCQLPMNITSSSSLSNLLKRNKINIFLMFKILVFEKNFQ